MCQLIEEYYADPEAGPSLCGMIRQNGENGSYAGMTIREMTRAITVGLRNETNDIHFYVGPTPTASNTDTGAVGRQAESGIDRLEILDRNIGILKWNRHRVGSDAIRQFDNALRYLAGVDALVIDLSQNGGGSGAAGSFLFAHLFEHPVYKGYLLSRCRGETEWSDKEDYFPAVTGPQFYQIPVYVLISNNTGSAAEYTALILQRTGRATLVGEATAGAANPAVVAQFENYTAAIPQCQIQTFDGHSIAATGVVPDVVATREEALSKTLELVYRDLDRVGEGRSGE